MSRDFPDWVNPWKAAEGQRRFAGSIPLKQLPRLTPLLANIEGESRFSAEFSLDEQGRPWIAVEVQADLPLTCQRSLQPYLQPVSRSARLAVVESLEEQKLLSEDADPVLVDEGRLAVRSIVEDELLLALPLVPRDPSLEYVEYRDEKLAQEMEQGAAKDNPFAVLKSLKSSAK